MFQPVTHNRSSSANVANRRKDLSTGAFSVCHMDASAMDQAFSGWFEVHMLASSSETGRHPARAHYSTHPPPSLHLIIPIG